MPTAVLERILALLDEHGVPYRHLEHEPTPTSEDAARVRGEPLENGGKALLLKADGDFRLFVLSAARRLDSTAVRRCLGCRRSRFATPGELLQLTGLVPGSVPPFGEPILPFPLAVDRSILDNERIAFNAGSLTHSIIMRVHDYRRVARIAIEVDVAQR
ncbi:MAG: YbaK/EbsC family protein [Planctomycetota bacterium]|jgi:prolyl-tRNA editing enzyme YbaK/EbsC (Cys-tRNA(Pro) deacylase)